MSWFLTSVAAARTMDPGAVPVLTQALLDDDAPVASVALDSELERVGVGVGVEVQRVDRGSQTRTREWQVISCPPRRVPRAAVPNFKFCALKGGFSVIRLLSLCQAGQCSRPGVSLSESMGCQI